MFGRYSHLMFEALSWEKSNRRSFFEGKFAE